MRRESVAAIAILAPIFFPLFAPASLEAHTRSIAKPRVEGSNETVLPLPIIELHEESERVEVDRISYIYEEKAGSAEDFHLSFSPDLSLFRPSRWPEDLNRGFTDDAIWLCFTVRSATSPRTWLLSAGPAFTDRISVYVVSPDGQVTSDAAGVAESGSERRTAFSDYLFRITLGPGEARTVYLRFASEQTLRIRASLWDSYRFVSKNTSDAAFASILLGIVVALFAYTLFIVASLRDDTYLFYLIYLFGLFWYAFSVTGAGSALLWRGNVWFDHRASPLFSCVMTGSAILFTRRYLGMKQRFPLWDKILLAHAAASALIAAGLLFLSYRLFMLVGGILLLSSLVAIFGAGFLCAFKRVRRSGFFLAAWSFILIGAGSTQLGTLGFTGVYVDYLWTRGELLGSLIQVLLLALGIYDTLDSMRREKEAEQKGAIEALERANRVKEDFLIGTSMEFRAPLYDIVGLASKLEGLLDVPGFEDPRRIAGLLGAEGTRLVNQITNIDAYSRLRNGDILPVAERFSLTEAVDGVVALSSHLSAGKDLRLDIDLPETELVTDIKVFQQILYNLFAEALKRSPSGRVAVSAAIDGEELALELIDSAPPLPEEVVERAFVSRASGPEAVGPGLDLFVTRRLAENLGGSLAYVHASGAPYGIFPGGAQGLQASAASGGCHFSLRLPLRMRFPEARRLKERRLSRISGIARLGYADRRGRPGSASLMDLSEVPETEAGKGTLLIADEDPVYLEILKSLFADKGYGIVFAVSAEKAVEIIESGKALDLVLLGVSGPRLSGLEACARIRTSRPLGSLSVVVMTDRERPEAVAEAFRAGADDYIPRLAPAELLFSRVDTLVALKHSVQEALETRRRIAELEKLKTLGVLSAGLAHEINTPNNAVLRNIPLLADIWHEFLPVIRSYRDEKGEFDIRGFTSKDLFVEVPELLSDIYTAGSQIKKIVEDLKDYSRSSPSGILRDVDMRRVVAYASRLLGPQIEKTTRAYFTEYSENIPLVRADFPKLTQVAINIIENALQSLTDPEQAVRVKLYLEETERGDRVVFECSDEGIGIPDEVLGRVFEPFFTTKRESGGTGLGLSVSLGIVRECGGDIEISSKKEGGALVRVLLPLDMDAAAAIDGGKSGRSLE